LLALTTLVLTALPAFAWLLALLAGLLLPAALLLALFATLLVLLAALVGIFVCHLSVSWLAPEERNKAVEITFPLRKSRYAMSFDASAYNRRRGKRSWL
jgi:hypothetical protein